MNSDSKITTSNDQQNFDAVDVLKVALGEAQQSIRSYDTKAQICAIGYLFSLNIVLEINRALWPEPDVNFWMVVMGWGVLIMPMLFFGYVLYPSRNSVMVDEREDRKDAHKILYIRHERYNSVKQIKSAALRSDMLEEFAFELLNASDLRDRKRKRFVVALVLAFCAFMLMFTFHFWEILSRAL